MRRREVVAEAAADLPVWVVRFVVRDWYDPAEPVPPEAYRSGPFGRAQDEGTHRSIKAYGRWRAARDAWAGAHGYDMRAKFGEKPGADTWAFLQLVKQHPDALRGVVETTRR